MIRYYFQMLMEEFIFIQVKEILLRIPEFPNQTRGVLWESSNRSANVFMAWNTEQMDVYVYHPERLSGTHRTSKIGLRRYF